MPKPAQTDAQIKAQKQCAFWTLAMAQLLWHSANGRAKQCKTIITWRRLKIIMGLQHVLFFQQWFRIGDQHVQKCTVSPCQSSVNSEIWLRFRVMLCSERRRDGRCDVGVWQNAALLLGTLQKFAGPAVFDLVSLCQFLVIWNQHRGEQNTMKQVQRQSWTTLKGSLVQLPIQTGRRKLSRSEPGVLMVLRPQGPDIIWHHGPLAAV